MLYKQFLHNLKKIHARLNGSTVEYNIDFYRNILNEIKKQTQVLSHRNENQLSKISNELFKKVNRNVSPDDLLVEAFALVSEAIKRMLHIKPFDVQIIGGIVLYYGKIAEMQTGEGKTLTAVFSAYLNALTKKGVHILTFNDYLARRDAQWMGPVYKLLGLNAAYIQEGMSIEKRRKAYDSDITYATAKEAGFDYLRDSLCYSTSGLVHRPFNYAIIDEADSIMIDEAKIPLIIAGASDDYIVNVNNVARVAKKMQVNIDFEFDEYARNIHLTDSGIKRIENIFNLKNLFDEENVENLSRLNCALHAEYLLHRDVDYIIKNGKVELVDEFTGRIADKRRWPDGLQAAIEAKENINIQSGGKILNSITIQHFLQRYPKICGMTATACAAEKEFKQFYNLDIVVIPPNKICLRNDYQDLIFKTKSDKQKDLIKEIAKIHKTKQPVLIGTRSIEESCGLSNVLTATGLKCKVLNAKNDELEAAIVSEAGKPGAITISTNMAGRGTDIKLGGEYENEKSLVSSLGGLYVIGTNRHESRRIDNQLRGRAGRQGDPGSSRFFISLEDDLFIKYNLKKLFPLNYKLDNENERINDPVIKKEIERVQRVIEGQNLEIKKTLYKYTILLEQQRKIIFEKRNNILRENSFIELFMTRSPIQFKALAEKVGESRLIEICRRLFLIQIDMSWSQYLAVIADIKEGIHLLRLGGQDPLFKFHSQSIELFDQMKNELDSSTIQSFNKLNITNGDIDLSDIGLKAPSSTWTYLINDNPFENMLGLKLVGNLGLSIGAGAYGFLFIFYSIWKKLNDRKKGVS